VDEARATLLLDVIVPLAPARMIVGVAMVMELAAKLNVPAMLWVCRPVVVEIVGPSV
jgi:hypothetical protein